MTFSLVKVSRINTGHICLENLEIYLLSSLTKNHRIIETTKGFLYFDLMIGHACNVVYFSVHSIGDGKIIADIYPCLLLTSSDFVFVGFFFQ